MQRIGRWASPDPQHVHGMGGGEIGNAFHYVSGNLLQARDPLGLDGVDAVGEAAAAHGRVQAEVHGLRVEMADLRETIDRGVPVKLWDLEHYSPVEAYNSRVERLVSMRDAGLIDDGGRSLGYESAVENGLITSKADQDRFEAIASRTEFLGRVKHGLWAGFEFGSSFLGTGPVYSLLAKAPMAAPTALKALNAAAKHAGISGVWRNVGETMSAASARFQRLVTGVEAGASFIRNGVKFDGVDVARGVLLDAKGPGFKNFVNKKTGEFYSWFKGRESLVDQAQRQLSAANGSKVEWVFANEGSMKATQSLFEESGVTGIEMTVKAAE